VVAAVLFALALALVCATSTTARAADGVSVAACIQANEQAGPLRRAGKLREARASLRLCSAQSCPVAVRKDCAAGAAQADADVPTVAFSVQDGEGNDLTEVKVSVDGQPLADKLDGKGLDVDPGEHVFRFESSRGPAVERRLVIVEGEKNRRERVLVGAPKAVPVVVAPVPLPAPPPPPRSVRRTVGLAVGGAGLGLLAAGGAAALYATVEWSAAKNACGPTFPEKCANQGAASSDRSATLTAATIADIGLAAGGVALVTAGVLVLTAPPTPDAAARPFALVLVPRVGPSTAGLALQGAF
jgi:hypothetical protein